MDLIEIKEGLGTFLISPPKNKDNIPRRSDSVFFNIHQEINRDFSVLALRAYANKNKKSNLRICEPLCGSGIRSSRYAMETPSSSIFCNDQSLNAVNVAQKNIARLPKMYSKKINLSNMECNLFLQKLNLEQIIFDFVDIDPYGTPIPFVQNSIQLTTTKGLLAFTATDLASLVGLYPRALYAKYSISHFNSPIGNLHEIATRALIAGIQRVGLTFNQSVLPILSLYYRHFIRCFFLRYRGVNRVIDQIGFVNYCEKCLTRYTSSLGEKKAICPNCNSITLSEIGPLFLGSIQDKKYLSLMYNDKHLAKLGARKKLLHLLPKMSEESTLNLPWSFEIPKISKKIGVPVPSIMKVKENLIEIGFSCYKTHFSGTSLKTNAQEADIASVLKDLTK